MKQPLSLLLALSLSLSLCACGGGTAATPSPTGSAPVETQSAGADATAEARIFTDSVGREVELPAQIDKVAVSGPLAQIVLFALCPDKLVGIANEWDASAEAYLDTEYYNLPLLGQLYGGKGELNLETLLSSGAPSATTAVQRTSSRTNTFPFRSKIFPRAAGTLSTFALLRKDVS